MPPHPAFPAPKRGKGQDVVPLFSSNWPQVHSNPPASAYRNTLPHPDPFLSCVNMNKSTPCRTEGPPRSLCTIVCPSMVTRPGSEQVIATESRTGRGPHLQILTLPPLNTSGRRASEMQKKENPLTACVPCPSTWSSLPCVPRSSDVTELSLEESFAFHRRGETGSGKLMTLAQATQMANSRAGI